MVFIRKNTKIIFLLVIPVYLFIIQNTITNKHTHFYANGIVITHSHPVDREEGVPINQHKHTKREICFFHGVYISFYDFSEETIISPNISSAPVHYYISNEIIHSPDVLIYKSPRAPPFLVS